MKGIKAPAEAHNQPDKARLNARIHVVFSNFLINITVQHFTKGAS